MSLAEESEEDQDLDMDLKVLLKNCCPILQSRSSAIVFFVLQLHMAILFPMNGKTIVNLLFRFQECRKGCRFLKSLMITAVN